MVLARRHTRNIERDLSRVVSTAIGLLADMRSQQDERIVVYNETTPDDRTAHDLIVRGIDASVLPVTQMPTVLSEWRKPSYREFEEPGKTARRLFSSFSECWKARNLAVLPKRCQALYGLLDLACGLAV